MYIMSNVHILSSLPQVRGREDLFVNIETQKAPNSKKAVSNRYPTSNMFSHDSLPYGDLRFVPLVSINYIIFFLKQRPPSNSYSPSLHLTSCTSSYVGPGDGESISCDGGCTTEYPVCCCGYCW